MPTISIITATFNSAATVRDTLTSVRAQDHPRVQHVLVDGASQDDTLAIVGGFPHVAGVLSEPDRGLYDAMNKGIALSTGDVIGILNSDDFYPHPQVLGRVAKLLERTGAEALYGDLEYVDGQDTGRVVRRWRGGDYRPDNFYRGWMPPHPTFFVRRSVYERFGVFNLSLRFAADYELMLRFLLRHGISVCYLPEVLVRMRTGGLSNASLRNRWRANREDRKAWELNGLQPKFYTLCWKPLSKLGQFYRV
jgi:glycosyltransferase involved in cell wall biosynthesis